MSKHSHNTMVSIASDTGAEAHAAEATRPSSKSGARAQPSRRGIRRAACGLLVAFFACGSAMGQTWNRMVVFGDSLSDTGSSLTYTRAVAAATDGTGLLPIARPTGGKYANGRWTNGTGTDYQALNLTSPSQNTIWHWELADRLNIPRAQNIYSATAPAAARTNYACGGAITGGGRGTQLVDPIRGTTLPVIDNMGYQVTTQFGVATATLSQETLYALWGGGNDIRNGLLDGTITTAAQANTQGRLAARNVASQIRQLATRAAATNVQISVVWPNVVPMNLIPDFADAYGGNSITRGLAQNASINFRNEWASEISTLRTQFPNNLTIYGLDFHNFFVDINNGALFPANPALFNRTDPILNYNGFTNTLFQPTRNSLTAVPAGWNPDNSIFWDRVHPTARIHALMGEFGAARVPAPGSVAIIAGGALLATRRRRGAAVVAG